jgi:hypothetical protein
MLKSSIPSIDAILESFPQRPAKIRGMPNYKTLAALKEDLLINSSSIPCTLGGGANGYLGVLILAPAYTAIIAPNITPFVAPTFPGNLPANLNGTAAQVVDQVQAFDEDTCQWCEYDNVTKVLCKQIINTIDNT